MSTYWRDKFENTFLPSEKQLGLDSILQEAQDAYWGWLAASLMAFGGEVDPVKLESMDRALDGESPMRMAANDCYDYAINGRLRLAKNGIEQTQMNDSWYRLATVVLSARPAIEVFSPRIKNREMALPVGLEHILFLSLVRARLDLDTHPKFENDEATPMFLSCEENTGYLTLKEIAVLGQMSERAVRNAAQPVAADRLFTRKEGIQTVVDSAEALRWLKGRRGFVVTRAN